MLLAFDDVGPGPVVVLLHGFPLDRSMWTDQRSSVGRIYRLILPDLRGHGKTAAPGGVYEVDALADDVLELLDALGLGGPVVFAGHSMGGYVALSIAARRPDRVKGLILVNTRASADPPEAAAVRRKLADEVESTGETKLAVATMLPRLFTRTTFEGSPDLVARTLDVMARTPARAVAGTLRGLAARPDRTADLASIRVPTLVLAGIDDAVVPLDEARRMAGSIPGATFTAIPGAGHMGPLEDPGATNSAILGFLEGLG